MIERFLFEYLINALWQLPLLLFGAWLLIRIVRPPLLLQHLLWLFTLLAAVMLPARGCIDLEDPSAAAQSAPNQSAPNISSLSLEPEPVTFTPLVSNTLASAPTPVTPSLRERLAASLPQRTGSITVSATVIRWSVAAYAILVMLCFIQLLLSCVTALRIRAKGVGRPLTLLESNLLKECARRIQLSSDRLPAIRSHAQPDLSPMIIGIRNPVLLLPESLRHSADPGFDEAHLIAILTHELTHIRRRDYLVNLVARIASLPVAWHPAVMAMHGRVRQTREMICDASAASIFPTSSAYARSLLTLAESIIQPHPHVEAVGLFDRNRKTLEERIMKLTEPQLRATFATRVVRISAGAVVLIAATVTAATLHLKPAAPAVYAAQTTTPAATPEPAAQQTAGQSVPPSEAASVPAPAPTPQAAPSPAPAPAPVPDPKPNHKVFINGEQREMTPEERAKFDEQMAKVREQVHAAMSQLDTAKLQRQIDAANLKAFKMPDIKIQLDAMKNSLKVLTDTNLHDQMAKIDSPEFKKQMDDLKIKIDSPEFRKQMDDLKIKIDSSELRKQMDGLTLELNSPEFQDKLKLRIPVVIPDLDGLSQIDAASIRLNKPEFKRRLDAAREQMRAQIKQANGDSAQIQKAVDQFDREVEAATQEFIHERPHAAPPAAPRPPAGTF